ncbi:hypothetical protein GCM10027610_073540 [Dactylosporangium cerinum]
MTLGLREQISGRGVGLRARGAQLHGDGNESLLGAVVQIAVDAAAFGVGGLDDPAL